jgi:hypothetical protein
VARPLTRAEATVIGSLLAGTTSTDRERIRASGLPARTFEVARQRVISTGWVVDRYVPDPTLLGLSRGIFALGRPFAERQTERARTWAAASTNVLLWESSQTLFGVFFVPGGGTGDAVTRPLFPPDAFSRLAVIDADLTRATVPVYFDFEGAWSRIQGATGTRSYPRSLPHGGSVGRPRARPSIEEVEALVAVPFLPHDAEHPGLRIARRFGRLARYRHRLEPFVERRYFLDPATLPGYLDWTLESTVFVCGRLRPRAAPEDAFRRLVSACRVTPFLYVTDARTVLFGGLTPPPARLGAQDRLSGPSVTEGLQESLEGIEVFREPVAGMTTVTNHRYDRLFDPTVRAAGPA